MKLISIFFGYQEINFGRLIPLALLLATFISCTQFHEIKTVNVTSPDGLYSFNFNIEENAGPSYNVTYSGKEIIGNSSLGFEMSEPKKQSGIIQIAAVETSMVDAIWKPVYGEKNEYPNKFKESLILLKGEGATYNIRIRAYNEGVAFRYEFMGDIGTIQKEHTEFSFSPEAYAWVSERAQSPINKVKISAINEVVERPLLVQLTDSLFTAIGEAGLVNYARMKFKHLSDRPGTLVSELSSEVGISEGNDKTPWRYLMASERPGQLLENNYLLLNLNDPNKIEDPSWIKPGKIIRETTLTTRGGIACVDFAVKHNLQYIEFDAGWYGDEYDDASDATTVTVDPKRSKGPLDLLKVIDYAKSKNIGVVMYVNRRSLEKQIDDVLALLKSWGVSGVKYGFVNVGPQEWTSWLHDAVRKAAEQKLMIDIHDEYRPTGYSRTYPNLMTQEGIRGDEESPDNAMVLNTIFTRMIAGAGDHTNCYFAARVTEKMGSHASQLAKAVCIYSPWQFLYWYDRPAGSQPEHEGAGGTKTFIQEVPELTFYDALPTVWDDTKVIGGFPGEYAIIARESDNEWFIGALNGNQRRKVTIPFDFLPEGKTFRAIIYSDDESLKTQTNVKIETKKISSKDILHFEIQKSNGLAIHLQLL